MFKWSEKIKEGWLKLFDRAKPRPIVRTTKDGELLSDWELEHVCRENNCPDCKGALQEGPQGGCSVNFYCLGCRAGFNLAFGPGGIWMGERITDARREEHARLH